MMMRRSKDAEIARRYFPIVFPSKCFIEVVLHKDLSGNLRQVEVRNQADWETTNERAIWLNYAVQNQDNESPNRKVSRKVHM